MQELLNNSIVKNRTGISSPESLTDSKFMTVGKKPGKYSQCSLFLH